MSDLLKRLSNLSPEKRELVFQKLRAQKSIDSNTEKSALATIQAVNRNQSLPLSFAQERLWFLDQLEADKTIYNISGTLDLQGSLDSTKIEQSIQEIIQRHEILRTTFTTVSGQPVQVIHNSMKLPLLVVDLSELPEDEQLAKIQDLTAQEAQYSFDLTTLPLLRTTLLKLTEQDYRFLVTMHHIITDGWSIGVFIQELSIIYSCLCQNIIPTLPELSIQYADFAQWQRQWLTGDILERQLSYWKKQLANIPPLLELPTDYPRPPIQSFQGATESFSLSPQLTAQLKQLSQQSGTTLFMTLLVAFAVLLSRYSRQEDIVIGSPIANRNRAEIETLIGFFVNTLLLRINTQENPQFSDLLSQVKTTTLDAYAHQDLPFEKLVEELKPERNMSYSPLFQVMFVLQNAPTKVEDLGNLKVRVKETESEKAKFDLTLSLTETETGLEGKWEYNTDLFKRSTIKRMKGNFQILLEGIVTNPKEKIGQLPLLTKAERQQILGQWNQTKANYPENKCIHQLFEEQVQQNPQLTAVVFEGQTLSYQELNEKANQLAHYLHNLGVKPESLVGICLERSLSMVIGLLGILKAGGAYVPLDPNYPQERLSYMLENSQMSLLLTSEDILNKLPPHQATIVDLAKEWTIIAQQPIKNLKSEVKADNLAYVIYTSGSTGKPKGVMNIHRGVVNRLWWMQKTYELEPKERVLQKTPFSFDVSVWEFFWTLMTGACLVVAKPEGHKDPAYVMDLIEQHQITTLHFVPSMLQVFLTELTAGRCLSLKRVICSGEALSLSLQKRFFECFACELHNLYGPTEAAIDVTFWLCQPETELNFVPIGHPVANTQLYVLDKYLQPLPVGVAGELHIGGVQVARGYLHRPDLTAEKFIPNPFQTGTRLYKTGDLVRYLEDGNLEYIGRIDNQVKLRGFRIELGEIESILTTHPDIREAVVIVNEVQADNKNIVAYIVSDLIPDHLPYQKICQVEFAQKSFQLLLEDFSATTISLKGENKELATEEIVRLKLILPGEIEPRWLYGKVISIQVERVVIEWQITATESEILQKSFKFLLAEQGWWQVWQRTLCQNLREYLSKKLPDYMIPSVFILLESLPLTANGKVDRKALPQPHIDLTQSVNYVAARNSTEEKLAAIYMDVLRLDQVGIYDNFFEIGGHSLLATQVISRLRETFSIDLPLRSLFEQPTIANLSELIEKIRLSVNLQDSTGINLEQREEIEL